MGVAVPYETLERLRQVDDPAEFKRVVFEMLGNDVPEPCGDRLVCVTYIENKRLANSGPLSKLEKPFELTKEDIWQGKAMLVIAKSPGACIETTEYKWFGPEIKPGDWIVAKATASTMGEHKRVPVRIIHDYLIEAKVNDPRDFK